MAGGVTELVIFGIICSILIVILFLLKTFVFKGKVSSNWAPGQHLEIKLPDSRELGSRPREQYIDPLAKVNQLYIYLGAGAVFAALFLFYFITKGSFLMGN